MTSSSYLRYPHLHQDLITFTAQDDVWVAPVAGGRAWRVSAEQSPPRNPRFTPDGSTLVWTVTRGEAPEVVAAPAGGGDVTQLSYWGHAGTKVKGFTADGRVLATSAFEQADSRLTWAYAVDLATGRTERLNYGPVDSVAYGAEVGDERPVVVSSVLSREPAAWKRYRGGTAGKLWIDADGSGEFTRLVPELDGNLCDPMWVSGRIAFLSDHEGHGNLYSVLPDGSGLRRHTDFEGFYVRHASSDGTRIAFESAGNLFVLADLDAKAVQLDITLGAVNGARSPRLLQAAKHLNDVVPTIDGRASVVEAHGTVHLLTHRGGPARVIAADPGVRARLGRPLGTGHVLYVADQGGEEALYIQVLAGNSPQRPGGSAAAAAETASAEAAAAEGPDDADPGDGAADTVQLPKPVSAQAVNVDTFHVDVPQGGAGKPAGTHGANAGANAGADGSAADSAAADGQAAVPPTTGSGADANGTAALRRIDYPSRTRAAQAVGSPDGATIAVGTEYGEVLLVDVATGTVEQLAQTPAGAVGELAFSPDSAWLLWNEPVDTGENRSRLRLAAVAPMAGRDRIIELTDGRFLDFSADFTRDGKYIAFLSRRSFDPVYDTHSFDLSFPAATKPFLLALAADTPSPFGPDADGMPQPGTTEPGTTATDTPAATRVDVAGLAARIIAVPAMQDRYTALKPVNGGLLWQLDRSGGTTGEGLASTTDKPAAAVLERLDLATRKVTRVVEELDSFRVSGDGRWVAAVHGEKVTVLSATAKAGDDDAEATEVDLDRIVLRLDPVQVWGQAFDEAWRLQRDFYYTPDMAGTDWEAVHARYRPIVDRLGSHDDLVDLLWELHGELGTSHAYVTPSPDVEEGAGAQGHLGAVFAATADGCAIVSIIAGESSDPGAFSPLEAPGVAARPGDILEAVNGTPVPAGGPGALLAGTAGKIVELTLRSARAGDGEGGGPARRRVAVVPLKSEERLRYQQWVADNRAMVRKASNGKFGYLHVPDMMPRGWAQLHRDLDTETAADALVVDVRRNRGGHTSPLVAEAISKRMDAWAVARGHGPEIYPPQSPRGPVVLLTDEFAGSDGDIITAVAKLRGIGPVVGMRTWGGVVGIDGKFALADGTGVTQPRYAFWFRDGQGFNVENHGVEPDIEVPFPPHDHLAGNDPQLEAAIGVLLEMQREIPTVRPPALAGYRKLTVAPLPPRP
ncbi:S41 family peptidase [Arthrobacter sp. STN4]|uniref:S41 family peptidase n=1 Tax=Arthrobacter sp. STN4 TaxID=2923276 RepID=UPI00211A6348|nr:S41 family peptidase [Arthrobacter sp. STN4]MCQ9164110.1 S41 family peptidase [Arthrobacter sp. STN4]